MHIRGAVAVYHPHAWAGSRSAACPQLRLCKCFVKMNKNQWIEEQVTKTNCIWKNCLNVFVRWLPLRCRRHSRRNKAASAYKESGSLYQISSHQNLDHWYSNVDHQQRMLNTDRKKLILPERLSARASNASNHQSGQRFDDVKDSAGSTQTGPSRTNRTLKINSENF